MQKATSNPELPGRGNAGPNSRRHQHTKNATITLMILGKKGILHIRKVMMMMMVVLLKIVRKNCDYAGL